MLGFKHSCTTSQFEKGLNLPSVDTLVIIANLFSVTIDWLTGRSNTPYSEEVILQLENDMLDDLKIWDELPENFKSEKKRAKHYTILEVRANILVAYHTLIQLLIGYQVFLRILHLICAD